METLEGTEWDVVIVGTGLPESLLALSLSRSGKRTLHLDSNEYYGGDEAALSLSEAEAWAERNAGDNSGSSFSHAAVSKPDVDEGSQRPKLASSRAYSLALAPHLIYSRSNLISTVVSARLHNQLDFQAVGSWFVLDTAADAKSLVKVPGGREDVFADKSLDLKSKRSLMKFLRFVAEYEEKGEMWQDQKDTPFPEFLQRKFGLPPAALGPILALTMSGKAPSETPTEVALSSIARHARSIGTFGPGFAAVLPKWGGLAEITQVACRACAVGGGVYVLGKKIKCVTAQPGDDSVDLELDGGEKITSRWLATSGDAKAAPNSDESAASSAVTTSKSISVVSSSLAQLFPPTSEGGVTPAGAVVVIPGMSDSESPVHILAHTSEAGECPSGQCVLYASVTLPLEQGLPRLDDAVNALLRSVSEDPAPAVLWNVRYQQSYASLPTSKSESGRLGLPPLSSSLALEDAVLDSVRAAWHQITGEDAEAFMKFEAREGIGEDDS